MSFALFVAVLVVLIVVHELGHFLVAKLFGVGVDEFGVGYPPRAFTFGTYGDTTYTLNWLPFGGFVRIFGEDPDIEYTPEQKKRAFVHKHRVKQAAVLAAGVVFNIVFAWILFSATLVMGAPTSVTEQEASGLDTRLIISSVVTDSPAGSAGLVAGDEIVSVTTSDDATAKSLTPSAVAEFIQANAGERVAISYIRPPERDTARTSTIVPAHGVLNDQPGRPAVGIAMALIADRAFPVWEALSRGFVVTYEALITVAVGLSGFFASLVVGSAEWSQIAGPIGIAGLVGDASSVGLAYLLYFTAFISINLALINLLPLPALDGGRLVLVAVEAARRRPIPSRVTTTVNVVGFALIILLMLVVTYHDIARLL